MAQDQKKTVGGNKPRPGNPPGGNQGQSAKDRSRAQSRPVSGKAPAGRSGKATGANKTGGGGGGGNKPRPGGRPAAVPAKRTVSGAMLAWGAVGLVVVIIVVLVVVKTVSGNGATSSSHQAVLPASATLVKQVTTVPASVFDTVGTNIPPAFAGTQPIVISGQPPLTLNGKTPSMMYFGAEYCPFCAAERWSMVYWLSQFGTFKGLSEIKSSSTDVYPNTNSFTFYKTSYTSSVVDFAGFEILDRSQNKLMTASTLAQNLFTKYDTPPYTTQAAGFPFIDIGGLYVLYSTSFTPNILKNLSWDQIASKLSNPNDPVTMAIVGNANIMTAATCIATGDVPASVCSSSTIKAIEPALKALKTPKT